MGVPVEVVLPRGSWIDGIHYSSATLRPWEGAEETAWLETFSSLFPVQRTTALLARCLDRLGPLRMPSEDAVRALTVGDREALLLHLRRITLGDSIQAVVDCPAGTCRERMDLELRAADLLVAPDPDPQEEHEADFTVQGMRVKVRFRLPTGADQEAAAPLAASDPQAASHLLLRRCIQAVEGDDPALVEIPEFGASLGQLMSELDPQSEILINLECPACGGRQRVTFDVGSFLHQEVLSRARKLYDDVHCLASHYHWSEAEILSMSAARRRIYIELIAASPELV
jgi:hypothetical protein